MDTTQNIATENLARYVVRAEDFNGNKTSIATSNDYYEINAAFDRAVHNVKFDKASGRGVLQHNYTRIIVRDRIGKNTLAQWVR